MGSLYFSISSICVISGQTVPGQNPTLSVLVQKREFAGAAELSAKCRWRTFFGTADLRAQSAMSGALSILIFSGLLTVIAIDHPFAGTAKVGPEALIAVINDFGDNGPR